MLINKNFLNIMIQGIYHKTNALNITLTINNPQGIVTDKHIGYSDETLAYLLSQPNA